MLTIKITGVAGSGKTALLHIIGKACLDAGLNVTAKDENTLVIIFQRVHPERLDKTRPIHIETAYPDEAKPLACSFCPTESFKAGVLVANKDIYICERCILSAHEILLNKVKANIAELKAVVTLHG